MLEDSFSFRRSSGDVSHNKFDENSFFLVEAMPGGRATKLKEAYFIARKNKLDVLTDYPPSPTLQEYREGDRIEFDLKTINPDHKSKIDGVIIKPSMQEQYLCDLVIVEQSSGKRYMFK